MCNDNQQTATEYFIKADVLNCQHFVLRKIHQGFSSFIFSSEEIFPSLALLGTFPPHRNSFTFLLSFKYCEIYLHFMEPRTMAMRPLSITHWKKYETERTLTRPSLSNHITIGRLSMICTWFSFLFFSRGNYISKISICEKLTEELGTKKRFCKYCSRFCFRILRISSLLASIPDWTVINLNFKFSISSYHVKADGETCEEGISGCSTLHFMILHIQDHS